MRDHTVGRPLWVRGAATLLVLLLAGASLPWCCLVPGSHHGHASSFSDANAPDAREPTGHQHTAAVNEDAPELSNVTGRLCHLVRQQDQLGSRPGTILSSLHVGWVFYPSGENFLLGEPSTTVAAIELRLRAPPQGFTFIDVPPPRRV